MKLRSITFACAFVLALLITKPREASAQAAEKFDPFCIVGTDCYREKENRKLAADAANRVAKIMTELRALGAKWKKEHRQDICKNLIGISAKQDERLEILESINDRIFRSNILAVQSKSGYAAATYLSNIKGGIEGYKAKIDQNIVKASCL